MFYPCSSLHEPVLYLVGVDTMGKISNRTKRGMIGYVYVLPFLLFFIVIFLGPALFSLIISFAKYRGYGQISWIGVKNYLDILQYKDFWISFSNTLFYWISHVVIMMPLAFFLALYTNSTRILKVERQSIRFLIFLPQMITPVVVALLFKNFFGTQYGLINNVFHTAIPWLTDAAYARWVVTALIVWRGTGYWFIIFLAGLTAIDRSILEAAMIDGATAVQKTFRIVIPLMKKVFAVAFTIDAIVSFRLFSEPNVLLGNVGALPNINVSPALNILIMELRNGRFGRSAAVGWILFLCILIIARVQSVIWRENDA